MHSDARTTDDTTLCLISNPPYKTVAVYYHRISDAFEKVSIAFHPPYTIHTPTCIPSGVPEFPKCQWILDGQGDTALRRLRNWNQGQRFAAREALSTTVTGEYKSPHSFLARLRRKRAIARISVSWADHLFQCGFVFDHQVRPFELNNPFAAHLPQQSSDRLARHADHLCDLRVRQCKL
jgi:hypothetical protein